MSVSFLRSIMPFASCSVNVGLHKTLRILLAICLKMMVGTASPKVWRIFISSFLRNASFSLGVKALSFSNGMSDQLNDSGTDIISITSLILNTLLSTGWTVFWLAMISFRVCMHGATLSQYWRVYLSPFFWALYTTTPFLTVCGMRLMSVLSNADCPSLISEIHASIFGLYFLKLWYMSFSEISPIFFKDGRCPITSLSVLSGCLSGKTSHGVISLMSFLTPITSVRVRLDGFP